MWWSLILQLCPNRAPAACQQWEQLPSAPSLSVFLVSASVCPYSHNLNALICIRALSWALLGIIGSGRGEDALLLCSFLRNAKWDDNVPYWLSNLLQIHWLDSEGKPPFPSLSPPHLNLYVFFFSVDHEFIKASFFWAETEMNSEIKNKVYIFYSSTYVKPDWFMVNIIMTH